MGGQLSLLQRMDMGLMDARILTILHQDDDVSGPEVWKDKNWVQVMPQKHALCIKIALPAFPPPHQFWYYGSITCPY
jgi:hypothetical protein